MASVRKTCGRLHTFSDMDTTGHGVLDGDPGTCVGYLFIVHRVSYSRYLRYIEPRSTMPLRYQDHRAHLNTIFSAAITAADPGEGVRRGWEELRLDQFSYRRAFIAGAGKAGVAMARAAAQLLGDRLAGGIVAIPAGGSEDTPGEAGIKFIIAGHPTPDGGSLEAGAGIERLLEHVEKDDLVIALISGGGSALLELPRHGVTLDDIQNITAYLLRSGAPIGEINTVRKHLSRIKGGGLARMAWPARMAAFILSDVVGDRLDMIASGPTVVDPTTVDDARALLRRYRISVPDRVLESLAETLKPGDPIFDRVSNHLIGSNLMAREAAGVAATSLGFTLSVLPAPAELEGEARECAKWIAAVVLDEFIELEPPPIAVIFGGETTVTVRGDGIGGRSQELALAAAIELDGRAERVVIAAFGTDGIDGPTPAAGAIATPESVSAGRALGLDAAPMLDGNDSHSFFTAINGTIVTGPTGTNVNDLVVALVYED